MIRCSLPQIRQVGVAEKSSEGKQGFSEAFNYSQHVLIKRARAQSFYWLINPKSFREATKIVHQFENYYVDKVLRTTEYGEDKVPNGRRYIFLEALAMETRDRKLLRDQMLNILVAGRDTTSSLLGSVFYFLARHQRVFNTLRREILETFGDGNEKKEIIGFTSLKDLQYLRFVINESNYFHVLWLAIDILDQERRRSHSG